MKKIDQELITIFSRIVLFILSLAIAFFIFSRTESEFVTAALLLLGVTLIVWGTIKYFINIDVH